MTANVAARRAERLIGFYVDKSRALPWRASRDPYRVWLSEVMLQQTTVATVAPRFARFLERWPTIDALAAASDAEVMNEWAGLGYYARARNLIACARAVAAAGDFPRTAAELRRLPGLGAYTSAAIAAIAFGEDVAPVDTNVARVIARLDGLQAPTRKDIERRFGGLSPPGRAGDIAQALMDLGATICRPRSTRCGECPLAEDCVARASGTPERFPAPRQAAKRPLRFGTAYWIEREGKVWLIRRPPRGLLGGMAALPGGEWTAEPPRANAVIATVSHVFTHFALELAIMPADEPPRGAGWWQPLASLEVAGLPTLYRRAAALVLGSSGGTSAHAADPA